MTAGCNFACYKSNLQFHLSCAFISSPPHHRFISMSSCFFSLALFETSGKLFWNTFNIQKSILSAVLSSPEFQSIFTVILCDSGVPVHSTASSCRTPPPCIGEHVRMLQPLCRSTPSWKPARETSMNRVNGSPFTSPQRRGKPAA